MHPKRTTRRLLPWAIVLTLGLTALTTSRGQPPDLKAPPSVTVDKTGALIVPLGGLVAFDPGLKEAPTDIIISNEDVLGIRLDPNDSKKLLLSGKKAGLSQLTIVQKDAPRLKYDVIVQPDLELLRSVIKRTVPTANVEVLPGIGQVIILSGYVTSPKDADTIGRLANSFVGGIPNNVINMIEVGGVQQVQIDVVIASVDRNQIRNRGFDFALPGRGDFSFNSLVSGLLSAPAGGMLQTAGNANLQFAVAPNRFFGALQALRVEGVAKFLAEPRVVTQSGRPAFFRAGGRQAVISGVSGLVGPGVTLEPFGTELDVLPIVYGNGMIWLDIAPRVTAVSQGLGIVIAGALSPGFTEQSVRSTVLLESGQTFVIGGIIQTNVGASSNKVPLLGDLPYFGTLFSRVTHEVRESELVILVTPRLVHPMDPCQAPRRLPGQETRSPDDYELFLENVLELPRGQRKVWNGKCYNAPYKCDPTAAKYPCIGELCTGPNGTCNTNAVPGVITVYPSPQHGGAPAAPQMVLPPAIGQSVPKALPQRNDNITRTSGGAGLVPIPVPSVTPQSRAPDLPLVPIPPMPQVTLPPLPVGLPPLPVAGGY